MTTWKRLDWVAVSGAALRWKAELLGDNVEDKLAALEKQDEIERMLAEIKGRKG